MNDSGFKEFFTFSKGEKNGIIILAVLLVILIFIPTVLKEFYESTPINNQDYFNKVDSFFTQLSSKEVIENDQVGVFEKEEIPTIREVNYFNFDPNTISFDELADLGFSPKQAQVILRYREKGGRFFIPEDFARIYVVDSTTYSRLKPYINIKPTNAERKAEENTSEINAQTIYIELNSADTLQIIKVNGLGKTFARRIVAYRELIGGFNSINQLAEVWGINSELVQKLSTQIWVDSTKIKTINLNLISYEDLKKNPYLTEYQAKGIIYYRNKVKTISSPDDLLQQKIITLDRYKKIRPYLRVN